MFLRPVKTKKRRERTRRQMFLFRVMGCQWFVICYGFDTRRSSNPPHFQALTNGLCVALHQFVRQPRGAGVIDGPYGNMFRLHC
jgi:hypothetical protein